ncbi:MAG: hypothetical protein FH751_00460 [Firmicutes bacterium]|nr:hypothetical protein [Bacillota bacterium]
MIKLKKILKILSFLIVLGIIIMYGINMSVINLGNKYIYKPSKVPNSKIVLVLGARVYSDGTVSPMLADRLDYAIKLYKNTKVTKILVSGDHGKKTYNEVIAMKNYVCSKGVLEKDVFMDHAGFNTYNSLYRVRDVFNVKNLIIVTQNYHLKRAIYIARKLDLKAYGVSSDKRIYPKMKYYKAREFLARIKDFCLVNVIKPKPKFLGKSIDITGDGRITAD